MLDNFGNDEWRQGAGLYWEQHPSLKICGPVSLWLAECNYHHHWQQLHKASVDKNKMYAIKTCSFRLLLNPALVLLTHKSCVMTKKGFEGIKPVAGSYLGLLPTVCILSGHRTIIRPISWPATFPTSKDISPRSHCWVSWAYQTDIWHFSTQADFHKEPNSSWNMTILLTQLGRPLRLTVILLSGKGAFDRNLVYCTNCPKGRL